MLCSKPCADLRKPDSWKLEVVSITDCFRVKRALKFVCHKPLTAERPAPTLRPQRDNILCCDFSRTQGRDRRLRKPVTGVFRAEFFGEEIDAGADVAFQRAERGGLYKRRKGVGRTMNMAFELKASRLADIALQEASLNIWDTKYRLKTRSGEPVDRDIDGTFERVARALASVEEPEKRSEWFERFVWALHRGARPAGCGSSTCRCWSPTSSWRPCATTSRGSLRSRSRSKRRPRTRSSSAIPSRSSGATGRAKSTT